ncbi:hypothetical protein VIBNISFn118_220014 [Vibrio nigripulchritudo SFn118]|nr:hypothetical protein VIBNISFn118_220014 [Vibrio nigripulchritudo SFn118]
MVENFFSEDKLILLAGTLFFIMGIACILFCRISVKHIDSKMNENGISPPAWDRGIGARSIMYAMVLSSNKIAKVSPVDDEAILKNSRKKDAVLAKIYLYSFSLFLSITMLVYFAYGDSSNY